MVRDLTKGSPVKLIAAFTLPILLGNIFQQLYNMADTFIVGRTLGPDALASVGCTGSVMFFILGFSMGLTSGLSIVIAQRFGAGDEEGVRRSFATGAVVALTAAALLTTVGVLLARPVLQLMQTPDEILGDASSYLPVIYSGIAASILFNYLSNVLRALGDSRTPLIFLVIASLLNIGLDYFFILVCSMGVAGAGFATVIAQAVSGLLCLVFIRIRFPILHVHKEDWRQSKEQILLHVRLAIPMGFQLSIIAIGTITVQVALNTLGKTAVTAYTAASKLDNLMTMPSMSFGVTMATYAAQNYGANRLDRVRAGVRRCSAIAVALSFTLGMVNVFAGKYLVMLFVGEGSTEILALAQIMLTMNGTAYFFLALLAVFRNTLQGLGRSFTPTLSGVLELGVRIFAAIVLTGFFGFVGACLANVLAWISAAVLLVISYAVIFRRLSRGEESARRLASSAEKA